MASALARRVLRGGLVATALLLGVALAAGLVRLLPWVLAPAVPLEVAVPFARLLGAQALEAAALVGPPIGFALGASLAVELGEARALHALGAAPERLAAGTLPMAAALAVATMASTLALSAGTEKPGRFTAELVAEGRASCRGATQPFRAEVPLVGVSWLCFPGAEPRVAGALPRTAGGAWFTASELVPDDDLTSFAVRDLRVRSRSQGEVPGVSLQAARGQVRGLSPWGQRRELVALPRALLLAITSALLAVGAAWVALRSAAQRLLTLSATLAAPLAVFVALVALDRRGAPLAAYALLPVVALAASALSAFVAGPFGLRVARRAGR